MKKKIMSLALTLIMVLMLIPMIPTASAKGVKVKTGYTSAYTKQKDGSYLPILHKLKGDIFDVKLNKPKTVMIYGKKVKAYPVCGAGDFVVPASDVKSIKPKKVKAKRDSILYGYDGRIVRIVKKGEKFTVYGTKHFGKDWINGYRVFYGAGYYNGYLRTSDFKKCK